MEMVFKLPTEKSVPRRVKGSLTVGAALQNMVGEVEPAIPEPKAFIDHRFEAGEYEKKLVQVTPLCRCSRLCDCPCQMEIVPQNCYVRSEAFERGTC